MKNKKAFTLIVRRFVSFCTKSENPNDYCEYCHDTGLSGDNGPGGYGCSNNEYTVCCCDPVARARRYIARCALASNDSSLLAFSLIELLVTIGIIFILTSLLLSSLSISKEQGRKIVCLNNLKNLQLAWLLYANDNEGKVVDNYYSYPITYNWVHGSLAYNVEDNTNTFLLVGYENSMLGSYTKDYRIYKCPSDRSISTHDNKKYPRVRSYSLNSWIGGENSTNYHDGTMNNYIKALGKQNIPFNFKVYKRDGDFNNSSYIFSFIDELPDSIDNGQFLVDLTGRALNYKNAYIIYNFVGFSHNKKGALAFVDGHVESKKWQEVWTLIPNRYGSTGKLIRPIGIPGSKDIEYLMSHATEENE